MINFSKIGNGVDEDFVRSKVSESTIFSQYFGRFELGKVYNNPLRRDRKPSAGFYVNKRGRLTFSDFSTGEKYDAFSFVAAMYGLNYGGSIMKIAEDFGLIPSTGGTKYDKNVVFEVELDVQRKTIIQIEPNEWKDEYLKFWSKYGVEEKDIDKRYIFPVKKLWLNGYLIPTKEIRFAYMVKWEGEVFFKIYSPYSKDMKWLSNVPLHIPFGLDTLPFKSKTLFITKSAKDKVVMNKIFTDVIATQNESEAAISSDVENFIKLNYDRYIIVWDNDVVGVENCKKFNDRGFGYFNIPGEYYEMFKIKDCSDFVEYYGIDALKQLFKDKGYE